MSKIAEQIKIWHKYFGQNFVAKIFLNKRMWFKKDLVQIFLSKKFIPKKNLVQNRFVMTAKKDPNQGD